LKKKILLLGINSFLGSNYFDYELKKNFFDVYGSFNKNKFRITNEKIEKYSKKIFQIDLIKGNKSIVNSFNIIKPSIIINFTGISNRNSNNNHFINTNIVKNILKSVKLSNTNLEHFYNIGSCEEYSSSTTALNELSKSYSDNLYGAHKIKIHKYCLRNFRKNNINYTNLRTFNIIGRDKFKKNILQYLIENSNKKKLDLKDPYNIRDFMWINDYILCLHNIIKKNKNNYPAINIGSGKPYSIEDLIKLINNNKKFKNKKIIYKFTKILSKYNIKFANNKRLNQFINKRKFIGIHSIVDKLI